ncbi:MAG: transporter [Alphaproteobacteria bacterium]|nr:transporter [Alphaproteobacteria bacterium]
MATGLLALLDDIAALVKASAASLDDIPAQVARTSGKVSGIVIDDAAVTPKYVLGLDPKRELAIIFQIAKKSLLNKIIFLGPAALLLGFFAPWAIQPILMLGGLYLCYEGYEKVHSMFFAHDEADHTEGDAPVITAEELEGMRIKSAVRTDFILSGEIIAITYATVTEKDIATQIAVMFCVAVLITVAVYGFVGLIVKADDIGVHLAKNHSNQIVKKWGRGLVTLMPNFLKGLSYVGTVAMLWVGAELIAHGVPIIHHSMEGLEARLSVPVLSWLGKVTLCAIGGLILGAITDRIIRGGKKLYDVLRKRKAA